MSKRLRWGLMAGLIVTAFLYLIIVSPQHSSMTFRQQLLQKAYPALRWLTGLGGSKAQVLVHPPAHAPVSFYSLSATTIEGRPFDLAQCRGKKVLLVNTASDCGYTAQYEELQQLHRLHGDRLLIVGFPANDFKQQEKGDDAAIAAFCKRNYGVDFPLMKKTTVVPGPAQHSVYRWLTDPSQNGWNRRSPDWNFSKYLVDEQGRLTHYFGPAISPLDERIVGQLR